MCRDVYFIALDRAPPMGGVDELIEIDESMMRRQSNKYHRGRPTPYQIEQRRANLHIVTTEFQVVKLSTRSPLIGYCSYISSIARQW